MPSPVSVARRCLTEEAARVLDDAVAVARRRSHAQTTSLHAVSALLALPSSSLREACSRARSSAYLPRLQFRALELSVGVSLDRLPSAKSVEEPPVSNSLMAAIKRSQANQRRQPENFHLQQIHAAQQNAAVLKVEMKHFVLSILDDPIVSRVLGEAGFRSCDVKMAIVHPPVTQSSRFSRCPPIFLCNLTDSEPSGARSFRFPFAGVDDGDDENCRRIGDVLIRKTRRNPLLVGVGAIDALRSFIDCLQKRKSTSIPAEISGLCVFDIAKEVSGFVVEGGSKETMGLKLKELGSSMEHCSGPGVIVNIGEIKVLASGNGVPSDEVSYVVSELKSLLELHSGKLWLIGAAGTEADLKVLSQFPSVEKDLDLHILALTWKPPIERLYSKSSLMGSFVPFGGFFSSPSDYRNPASSTNPSFTRCHLCSEKFEQEKAAVLKAGSTVSVADQHSASLPPWLRMAELDTSRDTDGTKTKDDENALSTKILGLQKKWNDICQRVHPMIHYSKLDPFPVGSQPPVGEGFRVLGDSKQSSSRDSSHASQSPRLPINEQEVSLSRQNAPMPLASEASVATDLRLGMLHASTSQNPNRPKSHDHQERLQSFSGSVSAELHPNSVSSTSCSDHNTKTQSDPRDFKSLRGVLVEKVGRQDEAICAISQALSRLRNARYGDSSRRGDVWLTFLGPDRVGKRRIASALAEAIFGSRDSLISIDLGCEDITGEPNSMFEEPNGCEVKWGKTIVDSIAMELRKKPSSVVFLENVDKADILARTSITQAIKTGKFRDSHGREISINNMVFVTTSSTMKIAKPFLSKFSEEKVLRAKNWKIQIVTGSTTIDNTCKTSLKNVRVAPRTSTSELEPFSLKKRKSLDECRPSKVPRSGFDLNLPVDQMEDDIVCMDSDSDTISENSEAWLEDFLELVHEKVMFKPFDFDALAEKVLTQISLNLQRAIGPEAQLDIDYQVMLQILAASWLSESKNPMEKWVEEVLSHGFMEACKRYDFTSQSVLRLVACEGESVNEEAISIRLPARIELKQN